MLLGEVVLVIFISTCFSAQTLGHSHSHGHAHSDEPPHLKYTREVNEAAINDHEHIHDDDHQHHNEHDHEHEHHGCGGLHHHGGEPHMTNQRMASTLPKIPTTAYKDQPYSKDGYLSFLNNPQIRLWTYAVGSTLLISAFPCILLAFIPVQANIGGDESPLLRTLLAFGAGGLLGDAFLHLIPHSTPSTGGTHSHSHSHSHGGAGGHSHEPHDLSVGTWVLVGFMTFFIVEKFVRIVRGEDSHGHSHGHSHGQSNSTTKNKAKQSDDEEETEEQKNRKKKAKDFDQKKPEKPTGTRIRVAAYLNLVADFMHNFTDGLAIGASFIAGPAVGFVTMITVLVHEVPHEIGDFAILVQSGISKPKAMLIQLCTALGALAGCILSLWDVDAAALVEAAEQSWAIPFTAGGFIYIGTVSMVPDLLEQSTAWQSVKEIIALLLGLAMMYAIAFFE